MQPKNRLALEALEARWCPALTATLNDGTLTISGTADNGTISISQDSTTAGTITVQDGTAGADGSPFTGVTNIKLNLTSADDAVTIDLGGLALEGNIVANLGAGANTLSVLNGEVGGTLAVNGAPAAFGRGHHHGFRGRGGSSSSTDTGADTITLADSLTAGRVVVTLGQGGGTVEVAADVTGSVVLDAFSRQTSSAGTTASLTGEIDGSVVFRGSGLDDSLTVSGDVGGSLLAATGAGADKVAVTGAVTGRLALDTGAGDDGVTLAGAVGGRAAVFTGAGADSVTVTSTAEFLASAVFSLGAGADTFTLDDAATIATMLVNGGTGTDTFVGTATRTGLRLVSF